MNHIEDKNLHIFSTTQTIKPKYYFMITTRITIYFYQKLLLIWNQFKFLLVYNNRIRNIHSSFHLQPLFGSAGGTVVVHVSLTTVTRVWFRPRAVIWLKVTLVTCEKSVVQFDSTKHRRFSPGTPVSSCHNTGPMRVGPYWTSRENNLVSW